MSVGRHMTLHAVLICNRRNNILCDDGVLIIIYILRLFPKPSIIIIIIIIINTHTKQTARCFCTIQLGSVMREFSYLNLSERMQEYDLQAHLDRVIRNSKLLTIPDPLSLHSALCNNISS